MPLKMLDAIPYELCIKCKGAKALCGWSPCPLLSKLKVAPAAMKINDSFAGPSTSVFIGRHGYPDIFAGPMASVTMENLDIVDNPAMWFGKNYDDIISMRSSVLRSKNRQNIYSKESFIEKIQEIALAEKPADIELSLSGKPIFRFNFSATTQPMGPTANIKKLDITSNTKISQKVEKIVSDDLKASEQANLLYESGRDVYKITTILSAGILGAQKKLVPTRNSITAIDDILTKEMLHSVREFPSINEYIVYSSEYLGNHFEILLMPGKFEYENFEVWYPGSFWSFGAKKPMLEVEYEPFTGRTKYADKEGGGYYAARIGVVEKLLELRRQARVIVFREISEKYIIPVGVWAVRENVRNAVRLNPRKFSTLKEAIDYTSRKLRTPFSEYVKNSRILQQRKLTDF